MKKRVWETIKTLLIVILFCTLLLLTVAAMPSDMIRSTPWLSTVLQPLAPVLGLPEAELAYVEDAQPVMDAAQPLRISIRNSAGRYTAQWDFGPLDAAFETLGGMLGQALDTAGTFTTVRADRLPQALSQPSVCFDYGFMLSAQLPASWLEATTAQQADVQGRMFILAIEDGQVNLYLSGEECLRAETDINPDTLSALLEQFRPDDSRFAFETDSHLTMLAMIPGSDPAIQAALSSSPCDSRYIESLATALGFNPYDETRYTDNAGVTYFSETSCSLQIATSGQILLTSDSAERFHADGSTTEILVEEARSMIQLAMGDILGDARMYLSGVSRDGDETIVTFDYVLNGIPVSCGSRPAATITFSGRAMTSMELLAAVLTCTDEPMKILPPTQVAAIMPNGSDLVLQYHRSADGTMTAGWVK